MRPSRSQSHSDPVSEWLFYAQSKEEATLHQNNVKGYCGLVFISRLDKEIGRSRMPWWRRKLQSRRQPGETVALF